MNAHFASARVTSFCPLATWPEPAAARGSMSNQLMQRQVVASLRALDVCVVQCEDEADARLSSDCRLYRDHVYGVLSNDSDCAIMRGVRWLPEGSLVMRWVQAEPQQRKVVEVDAAMQRFFAAQRFAWSGASTARHSARVAAPLPQPPPSLLPSRPPLLVVTYIACTVWTNATVSAALRLPSPAPLVDLALLTGNDYTKRLTSTWRHLISNTAHRSEIIERWVHYLLAPERQGKRLEELPDFAELLRQSGELRRAIRHSRVMYDGVGNDERDTETAVEEDALDSLTADLDALQLSRDDLTDIRHRVARGELNADTLSVVVRDYDFTAVYMEQLNRTPEAAVQEQSGPHNFRSLLLPPCEKLMRPLRAALGLLCGKRKYHVGRPVGNEYRTDDLVLDNDELLPHFLAPVEALRGCTRLPLLLVARAPLEQRMRLFCAPIDRVCPAESGESEAALAVMNSSAIPSHLRLPTLACRFVLQSYHQLGLGREHTTPLIDSLIAMVLVLHAVSAAALTVSRPHSPWGQDLLHPPLVRVHASHDPTLFPLMLAAGLGCHYQAACSNLLSLAQQLQLPSQLLPPLPPAQLFHGPLLLFLVQTAVRSSLSSGEAASTAPLPRSSSTKGLPPSTVHGGDVQRAVLGHAVSASSVTQYQLVQAIGRSFSLLHSVRCLVWLETPAELPIPSSIPPSSLSVALPRELPLDWWSSSAARAAESVQGGDDSREPRAAARTQRQLPPRFASVAGRIIDPTSTAQPQRPLPPPGVRPGDSAARSSEAPLTSSSSSLRGHPPSSPVASVSGLAEEKRPAQSATGDLRHALTSAAPPSVEEMAAQTQTLVAPKKERNRGRKGAEKREALPDVALALAESPAVSVAASTAVTPVAPPTRPYEPRCAAPVRSSPTSATVWRPVRAGVAAKSSKAAPVVVARQQSRGSESSASAAAASPAPFCPLASTAPEQSTAITAQPMNRAAAVPNQAQSALLPSSDSVPLSLTPTTTANKKKRKKKIKSTKNTEAVNGEAMPNPPPALAAQQASGSLPPHPPPSVVDSSIVNAEQKQQSQSIVS